MHFCIFWHRAIGLQLLRMSNSSSPVGGVTEMVFIMWHTGVCVGHLFVSPIGNAQEVFFHSGRVEC